VKNLKKIAKRLDKQRQNLHTFKKILSFYR